MNLNTSSPTHRKTGAKLKNNEHSIECQITKPGFLNGGPLGNQQFRLAQLHLHWEADDIRGSEHTIDGKQFAAEIHLVHWNTKYGSLAKAANKSDGLAVLGIMIKFRKFKHFPSAPVFIDASSSKFQSVEKHPFFSCVTIPSSLDPINLLPDNIDDFWTYEGSLTTPHLDESVQWIVFKEPVAFSYDQLDALRSLIDSD
ncbi:hypothetical protein DPMN_131665 [Dreissena polymorpha]|uniref:Carbonic anhydrase n=1 Tax=Dreissena polymorpha TaxID=45954 RepID=A0A9D4J9D3_DREPO|nr:hypothetical protein DPMN_131665 [Dreissena polymorpha]